jgi:hypothetical protein
VSTPALVSIGLVCASALAVCILLELALRLAGWDARLQSQWMLGDRHLVLDSDVILIPERLLDPAFYGPAHDPVVLTLGDSFTQGFPVAADRSYPTVLQRLLAARGVAVDVRNAGMGDSGPDQQLRLLTTRLLPSLRPTVVVWQLYANDVWDNVTKAVYDLDGARLVPLPADRHWIAVRQRVFAWTPLPAGLKKHSRLFQLVLRGVERATRPEPPDHPTAWSLAKIARELDEFERLAARYGFAPYLVLVPPQTLYLPHDDPAVATQQWSIVDHDRIATLLRGRRESITVVPRRSAAAADFATAVEDPQAYGVRHFNARGYARLAAVVARRLVHDRAVSRPAD